MIDVMTGSGCAIFLVSYFSKGFRNRLKEHIENILNLFIGPFICLGYFMPSVDLGRVSSLPILPHSKRRAILGMLFSAAYAKYIWLASGSVWMSVPVVLYGFRSLLKLCFPKGMKFGAVRLLARVKLEALNNARCFIINESKILPAEEFKVLSHRFKKIMIHVLGSADNITTYVGRVWASKGFIANDDVCNVCIEQPGLHASAIYQKNSFLAHAYNLYLLTIPFWIAEIGFLYAVLPFLLLAPVLYESFSMRQYSKKIEGVVQYLKRYEISFDRVSLVAYSLGGVAALMWRYIHDQSQRIRLILDRIPHAAKIHDYGAKRFLLPSVALTSATFAAVYSLLGAFCSVKVAVCLSLIPAVTLMLLKGKRADFLKFCLKGIGDWTDVPELGNASVHNVTKDQVLGEDFLFTPAVSNKVISSHPGTHMDTPEFGESGDIQAYKKPDNKLSGLLSLYESVINRFVGRELQSPKCRR